MSLATGVDIVEVERVRAAVERFGERFLKRFLTERERAACGTKLVSIAGRWAAKEAVAKALGCGIGDVAWKEIEVLNDERGAPHLYLHGQAAHRAAQLGLHTWSLSISHTEHYAVAFVVALG